MNFDTPTSPLQVSVDVIATIMFCSLGHWTTFPLGATPQARVSSGRKTINVGVMSAVGTKRTVGDQPSDVSV